MTNQVNRAIPSRRPGGDLAKGLLLGAMLGIALIASRKREGPPPPLLDWDRVRSAARVVGDLEAEWLPSGSGLEADPSWGYAEWVRQSADLIGRYVGTTVASRDDSVFSVSRDQWIEANLSSFRLLFAPLERINQELFGDGTVGSHAIAGLGRLMLSSELGLLVGYLSRRVLGQYDLALLGREPLVNGDGGRLYFVEPNIALLQERLDLDPREFRLWIALHETTHAFEFENHPWVRGYMNDLLGQYFDSLSRDLLGLRKGPTGASDFLQRIGGNLLRSSSPLDAVMNAEQRAIFGRLQALMCLLEGYSNHIMDHVGSSLLASYPLMKARFEERRRNQSVAERLFARLTGLDVKLEQYVLGERFVGEVVHQRGIGFVNRAWEGPAMLPTMAEIRDPSTWVARVGS